MDVPLVSSQAYCGDFRTATTLSVNGKGRQHWHNIQEHTALTSLSF